MSWNGRVGQSLRLHAKVVGSLALICLIAFVVVTVANLYHYRRAFTGFAAARAEALGDAMVARFEDLLRVTGGAREQFEALVRFPSVQKTVEEILTRNRDVTAVALLSADGQALYHVGQWSKAGSVGHWIQDELGAGTKRLFSFQGSYVTLLPITDSRGAHMGTLWIAISEQELKAAERRAIGTGAFLLLVGLGGLAFVASRRIVNYLRQAAECDALVEINRALTVSLSLDEILPLVSAKARELLDADRSHINKVTETGEIRWVVGSGFSEEFNRNFVLRPGEGVVGRCLMERRPAMSEDILGDSALRYSPEMRELLKAEGYRAVLAVPILVGGEVFGALVVTHDRRHRFSEREVELLTRLAGHAAIAIQNARLFQEEQERRRQLEELRVVTGEIIREMDLTSLLKLINQRMALLVGATSGVVYLWDDAAQVLVPGAWHGLGEWIRDVRIRPGEGITGTVAQRREGMIANDYQTSAYVLPPFAENAKITAVLAEPLLYRDQLVGVITVNDQGSGRPFTEQDRGLLSLFAANAAIAIENARLFHETQEQGKRLEAKNQELEAFVYTVTHDLRAPLVAMQGMAAMLAESKGAQLDDEGRHYLDRLIANTNRMEELIRDLLEFSRVGRLRRPPESVAVQEVLDELLLQWADPIRTKGIKVSCRDLPVLWGERTRIEQVFSNLIGNALKFLGAENPAPAIEVGAEDRGQEWECYVRDNGIGIDPAYHGKVFELFQRLREVGTEGTGVGLAIVKKIVDLAGGKMWIESEAGKGATFRFTWPKVVGKGE